VQVPASPAAATALASGPQPRAVDSVLDSPLTQTGVLIGTPAYMAPEQFAGHVPDPRSDQFAFCVTAWEALTGARPFRGKTLDELRAAASAGVHGDGGLPPAIRGVLARGLSPDPAARWPDMRGLLTALQAAIDPQPSDSAPLAPPRHRIPIFVGVAIAVIAMVVGATLYATHSRRSPATRGRFPTVRPRPRRSAPRGRPSAAGPWFAPPQVVGPDVCRSTGALEEVRQNWIKSYEKACAAPASAARHEKLACLFEARDEIEEATRELVTEDADLTLQNVIQFGMATEACKHD